jgi:hypothetical protein
MTPDEAAAYDAGPAARRAVLGDERSSAGNGFNGSARALPRIPVLEHLSGPQRAGGGLTPVTPQYYYVRPEHTSSGYIEGRYGRIDNYTPGEHTSRGYIEGHYRGDGAYNYTRPEHASTGYIPGHYRAEPVPFGQATGAVRTAPAQAAPPSFIRP